MADEKWARAHSVVGDMEKEAHAKEAAERWAAAYPGRTYRAQQAANGLWFVAQRVQ